MRLVVDDRAVPTREPVGMTISPAWRKTLLTVHVATAVGWLGSDFVMLALGISGLSGADTDVVYPAMYLVARVVFAPLSFVVLAVAVLNGLLTPWGLFRWWWVVVKLALVTVMVVLVVVSLLPGLAQAADLRGALALGDRVNMVVAPSVSTTMMLVATVLSTFKPWGRTPWSRAPRGAARPAPGVPAGRS
jgi:hypothetical protein